MGYNLADHTLDSDEDILLCEEHEVVQHFDAGTRWGEVYKAQAQHIQDVHRGAE